MVNGSDKICYGFCDKKYVMVTLVGPLNRSFYSPTTCSTFFLIDIPYLQNIYQFIPWYSIERAGRIWKVWENSVQKIMLVPSICGSVVENDGGLVDPCNAVPELKLNITSH